MGDRRFSVVEFIERVQDDSRLRQRVVAVAGASAFFAAALFAVGLGQVVLVVVGIAVVAGVLAWSVQRDDLRHVLRAARSEQARRRLWLLVTSTAASVRSQSVYVVRRTWAIASRAVAWAHHALNVREPQVSAEAVVPPTADELYGWPYAGSEEIAAVARRAEPSDDEERRRVFELNARGTHLRRAGNPAAAVALHLEALEIFGSLDDPRAQARTLNSLALALAANGETAAAVERFEQSLLILRGQPNDPGEGAVIANLGFTLLRQGDDDRARELLSEALEKLPPHSRKAHKVEAQLRRAS